MTLLVPDVGEVELLNDLLANGQNWTLKLYSNNVTPGEGDTAGTYTEATFTGYSPKTLTRTRTGSTWENASTAGGVTSSRYNPGTPQSWSPTSTQSIYGYYVVGASSAVLQFAEIFSVTPKNLSSGDTLNITPKFGLE
jgi:hypothetical protein